MAAPLEVFDCVVDPARSVKVSSPVRGILSAVRVERGDTVEEGQVLAELEASVEIATVELNRIRAGDSSKIEAASERMLLAQRSLERALQLEEQDVVSQKILDELETTFRVAEKELAQAKIERELAGLELERSKAIRELRTVRSPVEGTVVDRVLSAGEFVSEDVEILTIVALDPLHVETFVPQAWFGRIDRGQRARVELTAPVGEVREALVSVVDPVFDPASGTFGVRLELPNPDEALPGGVRCRVSFPEAAPAPAALLQRPVDEMDQPALESPDWSDATRR